MPAVAHPSFRGSFREKPVPTAARASTSILIPLFIISLAIPVIVDAGPLRLSPYRAILLVAFVPLVIAWLAGSLGRIRLPDVLILLSALWGMLALTIHHGVEAVWETSGILLIETFGAYLLARRLIRNERDFRAMVRVLFWTTCALLPFAVIESLTNRALLMEALDTVATVLAKGQIDARYGFHRAQVAFEHPILYGVFSASGLGLAYYVLGSGKTLAGRVLRCVPMVFAAMLSLSSGAAAGLVSQVGLLSWDRIATGLRKRWRLFALLSIAAYVVVDILSNRTPFHVFITYLTFSPSTGYGRITIWQYGSAEVLRNPVFGIGLAEWERPAWLSGSMDNFWLVVAVRYGLPAFLLLAGALILLMSKLGRLRLADEQARACRAGFLISLGGMVIAACTVHYWNAIYVWFMFLIGSGVWMLDAGTVSPGLHAGARSHGPARPGSSPDRRARPARPS